MAEPSRSRATKRAVRREPCGTSEEAAARMRVTQRTVYTWLRQGALRGLKAGRAWRIRDEDMQAFLERHEKGRPEVREFLPGLKHLGLRRYRLRESFDEGGAACPNLTWWGGDR